MSDMWPSPSLEVYVLEHCKFFCFLGFLGLATQKRYHRPRTTKAWPSTSRSRTFFKVRHVTFPISGSLYVLEHCIFLCFLGFLWVWQLNGTIIDLVWQKRDLQNQGHGHFSRSDIRPFLFPEVYMLEHCNFVCFVFFGSSKSMALSQTLYNQSLTFGIKVTDIYFRR